MVDREISFIASLQDGLTGPLKGVVNQLQAVQKVSQQVSGALDPLANKFTQLAASFVSIQGARAAITAAAGQERANARLLNALNGQVGALQKIQKIASDLQELSPFGDDALLDATNQLIRMGVQTEDLDKGLRAAVKTSVALGVSLDTAAKSFGGILTTGSAGELGSQIPVLNELIQKGKTFSEIADVAIQRFSGVAEATVAGPFGQLDRQAARLSDTMERFGNVLIRAVLPVMREFNNVVDAFADIIEAPVFKTFFEGIGTLAPIITRVAGAFGALVAGSIALKAALFTFGSLSAVAGTISTVVGSIAGVLISIPTLITAIVGRILFVSGILEPVFDAIRSVIRLIADDGLGSIRRAIQLLLQGQANIEDVFALVSRELSLFAKRFERSVFVPVSATIKAIVDVFIGTLDAAVLQFKSIFLIALIEIADATGGLLKIFFSKDEILSFTGSLKSELEETTSEFETALTRAIGIVNLPERIREQQNEISQEIEEIQRDADQIEENLQSNRLRTLRNNVEEFGRRVTTEVENIQASFTGLLSSTFSFGDGVELDADELFQSLTPEKIRGALGATSAQVREGLIQAFDEAITRIEETDSASAVRVAELRIALLDEVSTARLEALEAGPESEGSLQALRAQLRELEARARHSREFIDGQEEVVDRLREQGTEFKIQAEAVEGLSILQQGFRDNAAKQLEVLNSISLAEQQINDLRAARALRAQEEIGIVEGIAQAQVDGVVEAFETLQSQRQAISDQFSAGLITRSKVAEQEAQAVEQFQIATTNAQQELDSLVQKYPEAEAGIANLRTEIEELKAASNSSQSGDFFGGVGQGIRSVLADFEDLEEQGQRVGETLITGFGQGLVDVLFDAKKSFSDFAKTFLVQILKMIAQIAIFRALSAGLGFFGGGAAEVAGSTTTTTGGGATGFLGFNRGGTVPGPGVNRDIVPAMLTPGEEVIDRGTARFYGRSFWEALRNRLVPRYSGSGSVSITPHLRYNEGGRVASTGAPSGSGMGLAYVVPDAQSLERLLSSGSTSMLRFLDENGYVRQGYK
jgi:lambda family phage tail tape measure protein